MNEFDTVGDRIERLEQQQRKQNAAILVLVLVCSVLLVRELRGQDYTTPDQALDWALADQVALRPEDRPWQRYLWIPSSHGFTDSWYSAASFALNAAVSQGSVIIRPRQIANGWLIAVDLRQYAPTIQQLAKLVEVWDSLAIDEPHFHVPHIDGNKTLAVLAPHLTYGREDRARLMIELNVSPALIYRLDWFLTRALDEDYYRFMQFGSTIEDVFKTIGVDEELAKAINGDQRAAVFISGVTKKVRRIDRIQGAAGRVNTGAVWMTHDIFDETAEISKHPIYNLLEFTDDGGEVIFERQNGMHGFVLVNAAGKLVAKAPPNLVRDNTIPDPSTDQLRPAISCIRCHGIQGEGLQTVRNDIRRLLTRRRIDIYDDFGNLNATREQNIDRLAGLYAGDFTRRITLGRDDYSLAVRIATQHPQRPQGLSVPELSELVATIYGSRVYDVVSAAVACRELGYDPGPNAITTLERILPPLPPDPTVGLLFADPVDAALKDGLEVTWTDFERIYPTARYLVRQRELQNQTGRQR